MLFLNNKIKENYKNIIDFSSNQLNFKTIIINIY